MSTRHVTGKSLAGRSKPSNDKLNITDFIAPLNEDVRWFKKNMHTTNRLVATARIFSYIWYIMTDIVVHEKKRVRLPYTNWFYDMGIMDDLKGARSRGNYKGVDILKTGFVGNQIYITMGDTGKMRPVYINQAIGKEYNKLATTTRMMTTGSADYNDIRPRLLEKYPFLTRKDVSRLFFEFRYLQFMVKQGCKIFISTRNFDMSIGSKKSKAYDYKHKSTALGVLHKEKDMYMFFSDKDMDTLCNDNRGLRSVIKLRSKVISRDLSYAELKSKCFIFKLLVDPKKVSKMLVDNFIYIGYYDKELQPAMVGTKELIKWEIKKRQMSSQED